MHILGKNVSFDAKMIKNINFNKNGLENVNFMIKHITNAILNETVKTLHFLHTWVLIICTKPIKMHRNGKMI